MLRGLRLLQTGLAALILLSCQLSGSIPGDPTQDPSVANKSIKLSDSDGHLLGYVFEMHYDNLRVATTKGYFVWMDWSGNLLFTGTSYYTGIDGTGMQFSLTTEQPTVRSNWVLSVIQGTPYAPKYSDANGFIGTNDSITSYQSKCTDGTNIVNGANTIPTGYAAFELKALSRIDLGLPDQVVLPLIVAFQ